MTDTPTEALAAALESAEFAADHDGDWQWNAKDIIAALPDDAAVFTPASLAAALRTADEADRRTPWLFSGDEGYTDLSAAIIQAAKEAEREQ